MDWFWIYTYRISWFLDATYLTLNHYQNTTPACNIVAGCETVTTSSFSQIAGIPVALLGMIYYLTILFLALSYQQSKEKKHLVLVSRLTPIGLLASIYFVSLQVFIIGAICEYCIGSALSSTLLFVLGILTLKKLEQRFFPKNTKRLPG